MGDFTKAVQSESVAGPLRRKFDEKAWAAQTASTNSEDANLAKAGLLVKAKADTIRAALSFTLQRDVSATTRLRALLAVVNANFCAVLDKVHKEALHQVSQDKLVLMPKMIALKIPLGIGASFSPDEVVESMVDGIELPIKSILAEAQSLSGNPAFHKADWDGAIFDFNLGILYRYLEDLWDECLWNHYRVIQHGARCVLMPADPDWKRRYVASRARHDNLLHQLIPMAVAMLARLDRRGVLAHIGLKDIRAIERNGKKQAIKITDEVGSQEEATRLLAARLYAAEPYYSEILDEPNGALAGATLGEVLSAWSVVSRATQMLREEARQVDIPKNARPSAWAPRFVPVLQTQALASAIEKSLDISRAKATSLVTFLTFHGNEGQEVWAQPLIPVSDIAVAPVFAALAHPNLGRLIDVWMAQLEIDLSLRGPAFELFVRAEVAEYAKASPLLRDVTDVLPRAFKFRPPGGREEEIDLLMRVGSLVMVCELKCAVHPAEAKQIAMHRATVTGAAAQLRRKVNAILGNRAEFAKQTTEAGMKIDDHFDILPMVVLNGAIHVGFNVEGIAVVDMFIIDIYFRGLLRQATILRPDGSIERSNDLVLYSDVKEAVANASAYFRQPPQMDHITRSLRARMVPVGAVNQVDWEGMFLTFEYSPAAEDLKALTENTAAVPGRTRP